MENLLTDLSQRFQTKGFIPIEIRSLLKDVSNIFNNGSYRNLNKINQELEELGWGIEIMDADTYTFIVTHSHFQ